MNANVCARVSERAGDVSLARPLSPHSVLSALATCDAPIVCTGDRLSSVCARALLHSAWDGRESQRRVLAQAGNSQRGRKKVGRRQRGTLTENDAHKVGGGVTLTADAEKEVLFSFFYWQFYYILPVQTATHNACYLKTAQLQVS